MNNFILKTDSYKETHWKQVPKNTTECYSYFESREEPSNKVENGILFFGLQYYLKKHFIGSVITLADINYAEEFCQEHFREKLFNRELWEYILYKHDGKLPLEIKAVQEGAVVPTRNVLFTIKNTDPNCFWLTNFAETLLSHVWYTCTVASNGFYIKTKLQQALVDTGCDPSFANYQLHDFGFRGVSCLEQAGIGGMTHLVNFLGTDTLAGIEFGREFYNTKEMLGFSVPASEHFTMTSWGREHESEAYKNMLEQYPDGIVSIVSDSYNIYNAVENIYGVTLNEKIMKRNGKLVIRPDSGNPVEVNKKLLNILWNKFGGTINETGYKVLDSHIGIIQGDGIDNQMIESLLTMMKEEGFATCNMVFGSGGGLLQKVNRDTRKFAIKASSVTIDNRLINVNKAPITDKGKTSKSGYLKLVKDKDIYCTISRKDVNKYTRSKDELKTVFRDGKLISETNFNAVKETAKSFLKIN